VFEAENEVTYSFFYLRWSVYWKTLLTTALHSGYPDFEGFQRTLRRFYYLHWIAGYTLSRIKQVSFNTVKWVKEKRPLFEIKQELELVLKANNIQARVNHELRADIYHDAWCKPLLIMCEYNQVDKPNWISMWDGDIHVEHILPQGFEEKYGWKHFIEDKEKGQQLIHTCGNLTLLSGTKNIQARNNPYPDKIKAYTGKGHHAESDNKVTAFRISQNLVDDYNAGRFNKEWNFKAIEERKKWFLGQIEQILSIDLTEAKK
jgi:hypothetical protein